MELLPAPLPGLSGWPWEAAGAQPEVAAELPRITVITPSFNQGQYLEETIRSVLLQGYPNLEYLVVDGGSTDNSLEILRKYADWITWWTSEADRGQAHAINKGLARMTGELVGWINSDDRLLPGALRALGEAHRRNPQAILMAQVINHDEETGREEVIRPRNISARNMIFPPAFKVIWHQPGVYVPAKAAKSQELLDESLRYLFDQDWMIRLLRGSPVEFLNFPAAWFRLHRASKTVWERFSWWPEFEQIARRYEKDLSEADRKRVRAELLLISAAVHLGVSNWNRRKGMLYLRQVTAAYPRILLRPFYWQLVGRSLLPFGVVRFVRKLVK